jgi:hypothetical protein
MLPGPKAPAQKNLLDVIEHHQSKKCLRDKKLLRLFFAATFFVLIPANSTTLTRTCNNFTTVNQINVYKGNSEDKTIQLNTKIYLLTAKELV